MCNAVKLSHRFMRFEGHAKPETAINCFIMARAWLKPGTLNLWTGSLLGKSGQKLPS